LLALVARDAGVVSVVSGPPSGTVTFLFSDIEGSTRLWEARTAAMASALLQHDKVLRAVADAHGGYVFATAGDGFAIAFGSAVHAVLAAVEAQKVIGEMSDPVPLRVRMGVHSGEAVERGGDYFGPVVNRAARLMGAANGGQIVCSLVAAELARPALPAGMRLSSLGAHRLKDLLEPEVVLQVDVPGLQSSFPPLRSLDVVRHNLPVQQTRLIGRSSEVATVVEVIEASRLVTLTGVGGCGKTRLALAVAVELAPHCRDGAFFVPLAVATDSAAIVESITTAIGARLVDANPGSLAAFLSELDVLLVLDNCEHLLDDVTDVVELLLSRGSGPRVVATSREALGAEGERVVRVPSLPVESDDGGLGPAVLLMLDRTGGLLHGAQPGSTDLEVVKEICRRLDGIPLAIELAAAQLDALAPRELLERLDQRFDLLVGGHGRRRQRQQTLQAMMEWSWELLDPIAQRLLAVLSVFAGDWPLEAAETVASSFVPGPVIAVLRRLTAKSLVEPVYAAEGSRFRLLETVRLFAAARVVDMEIADDARHAHAAYHVERARRIGPQRGFNDGAVIAAVRTDLADIDAALGWLATRAEWASAAGVALLAGGCWTSGTQAGGGLRWFQTIETHLDDPALHAVLLATGGFVAIGAGEPDVTRRWEREALDIAHDDGRAPYAVALAGCIRAAPLILTEPQEAREQLLEAAAGGGGGGGSPR
jgi:predicted ATPase/class 3 adenylate cyclase